MPTRSAPSSSGREEGRATKKVKRSNSTSGSGSTGGVPPLGKFLASSEKPIRDKAVASLTKFLSAGKLPLKNEDEKEELLGGDLDWDKEWKPDSRLDELEMAKLWKGIYYCFWMSDKPLVQQALAQTLADLTLIVRPKSTKPEKNGRVERVKSTMAFLKGFWVTVCREWVGLDRLRIDKFYLLIRRFIEVGFKVLEREDWDPKAIELYNEVLTSPGGPLHVESAKTPHSLTFHLSDIFLDELERVSTSVSSPTVPLVALLQPYMRTLTVAPSSPIFARLIEKLFKPLLIAFFPPSTKPQPRRRKKDGPPPPRPEYPQILEHCLEAQGEGEAEGEGQTRGEVVAKKVLKSLFEVGGRPEVDEHNRRKIYQFVAESEVDLD
ncbi:Rrp1p [Sporobolomyces salmoneus]|uniref:Rrp1p n=1 Tax=Sporobolomyces salmoneus TaxID=183962 RepID=UPI00317C8D7A